MNWIFLRGAVCFVWSKDITKKAACTKTCLLSTVERKRLVFCSPFCFRPCSNALWGAAVCVSVCPESSRLLEDMIWLKLMVRLKSVTSTPEWLFVFSLLLFHFPRSLFFFPPALLCLLPSDYIEFSGYVLRTSCIAGGIFAWVTPLIH